MSKQGERIQKNLLRKLAKDERLHPNKRFLAILLLGVIDGQWPINVVMGTYNNPKKVNWEDYKEDKAPETNDKEFRDAKDQLKSVFAELMVENADTLD